MKTVQVIGHSFDCLPAHVQVVGRGTGSNLRIAVCDALRTMFADERLHRKHINDFKVSVVVLSDKKGGA